MRRFLTKKYIFSLIALVVVGGIVYSATRQKVDASIQTDTVKVQDLKQTVLATGQVSSSTDLSLTFKGSGVVTRVGVKVGDLVKAGQILANVDQRDQLASVTSARGSYAQATANYKKVIAGASGPDVDIAKSAVASAQTTLNNAKASYDATVKQQDQLVSNAFSTMLNSGIAATPVGVDSNTAAVTISGTYTGNQTGSYRLRIFYSGLGAQYSYAGLESGQGVINRGIPQALGKKGLYVTFSNTGNLSENAQWDIDVPNMQSSTYTANNNAYQSSLQSRDQAILNAQNAMNSAQSSVDQANAQLASKQSAARPEDVAVARAQILSASGQVAAAEANLENTVIRAPANGTITTVDVKVGEQATPSKAAIVLQDVDNLHSEANISEANIASIKLGQVVSFTFDALGPDRIFNGTVQLIDPASTVVSGVVNYKVTASVDKLPEIKPGMTANMTILVGEKKNVMAIPQRAVLSHDGKKFVRVVSDSKKKTYNEVEVTTGMEADGGLVEITSGLSSGQEIVTFIAAKK